MRIGVGDTIGQYQLLERLGQGGMAVVFRAYQPSLDREVAVKILTATWGGPDFVERFRREARAVSKLRHPNILAVFDFGEEDGLAYMVGELITGGTLAQRLGRPLPLEWIGVRLTALASALDYAHSAGLIHRDVKPSNVLLTSNDVPILSDFGVAKVVLEGAANLTVSGMVVGTPEYMSPEQALGQEVGPTSDVYSLGVVLFEMLTGRPPYSAATPVAVALAHVHNPLPSPRSVNAALPEAVEQVLMRCLDKSPGARYQQAGELASAYASAVGSDIGYFSHLAAVTPPAVPRITPSAIPRITPPAVSSGSQRVVTPPVPVGGSGPSAAGTSLAPARAKEAVTGGGSPITPSPRRSRSGLLGGAAVAVALLIGAARPFGLGPFAEPVATARPTAPPTTVPTATSVALATPTEVSIPTAAATVAAQATEPTLPTPRIAEATAPPRLIGSPINGDVVPQSLVVRGRRTAELRPDQHLWLMVRPRVGPDNWWAADKEIQITPNGDWQAAIHLGGEAGSFHRILIGVASEQGHQAILKHLAEQPGAPFERGLPAGFTGLEEISVEKRGD